MPRFKSLLTIVAMLLLAEFAVPSTVRCQSRIEVLDSIALPEEYLLDIQSDASGYAGIATVRQQGSLCGGNSAWIELDSTGKTTRFVPLILDNGKAACAYQYFRRGDELYTFHENTNMFLLRWDKDLRFVKEIPIQFPKRGLRYNLGTEAILPPTTPDGSLRVICRAEQYRRRRKEMNALGAYDWSGPSWAILEIGPDGNRVTATTGGRFPAYYRNDFPQDRHHAPICLSPEGKIIQSFGMGGSSFVYDPSGRLMDSLPCPTLSVPADEKHVWSDKIHTLHSYALKDAYTRMLYDQKSERYLRAMIHAADKATADSILATNDYMGMSHLVASRQITVEIIQRNGFRSMVTLDFPLSPIRILRTDGDDLWVHSLKHVYHCRIVHDQERQ